MEIVNEVENTKHDSHKMFKAVKKTKLNMKTKNNIKLKDDTGRCVHNDNIKIDIIKNFFEKQFKEEKEDVLESEMTPSPLANPISLSEVIRAIKKLKTCRAMGPDNIENELIKNAEVEFAKMFQTAINKSFESGIKLD